MQRSVLALFVGLSLAGAARAQVFTSYLVSTDLSGETPFTSDVTANPGQPVLVRLYAYWSYPNAIYFGGLELTSIPIDGANPDDLIDLFKHTPDNIEGGLIRRVFGTKTVSWIYNQSFSVQDTGPSQRTIVTDTPKHPITMLQDVASHDNDYITENPIWTLQFLYTPVAFLPGRELTIGGDASNLKFAAVYTSLTGSNHTFSASQRTLVPATIHVSPAPGALSIAALGLFTRRRR